MAGLVNCVYRSWRATNPPAVPKAADPILFGILGASKIAPESLIIPARTHPDVVIQAVAARDKEKAEAYAHKYGIPVVLHSYEAILEDPTIDVIYIALPNGLHFEWALKALQKGKHVLLEKPSVSNAEEAELLFRSSLLAKPDAPVILEAVHYHFDPTWRYFISQINPAEVAYARHSAWAPKGLIPPTDIRFIHELGGGAIMDIGSYGISTLRSIFSAEPEACEEANVKTSPPPGSSLCDSDYVAKLRFPNGGIGEIQGSYNTPWLKFRLPSIEVTHRPTLVHDDSLKPDQEKTMTRKVSFYGHMMATLHNRIDTEDFFEVCNKVDNALLKKWAVKKSKNVHSFHDIDIDQPGEQYWKSYRHQLEQFVHRIRGRTGDGVWVSAEQSIAQMKAIDVVYEKSGLGPRPSRQPQGT